MSTYVASNSNRFYVATESSFGQAAPINAANRFPAVRLEASQIREIIRRLNKTGTRTYQGSQNAGRLRTAFSIQTYLTTWNGAGEPSYGPLFAAAMGAVPSFASGCIVNSCPTAKEIVASAPHGLQFGDGVSIADEIRFVTGVLNPYTLTINAPFTRSPQPGQLLNPSVTYRLSNELPSFSLYDYWDSQRAIDRLVTGCAVGKMDLFVNGDYHDFRFSGPAANLIDKQTITSGVAGLTEYPAEPSLTAFSGSGVPGHLGQAWLGDSATEFLTLTEATVSLNNSLDLRQNEFGCITPSAIVPGERKVVCKFSVLVHDDDATQRLYVASRERTTIQAMLQLGAQQGQLMGVFLPQVSAGMPDYNDSEARLRWDFNNNVAQGGSNDEIFIAFA